MITFNSPIIAKIEDSLATFNYKLARRLLQPYNNEQRVYFWNHISDRYKNVYESLFL